MKDMKYLAKILYPDEDSSSQEAGPSSQPVAPAARSQGQQSPAELAEWLLADKLPVRFQLQLHKVLWGDVAGK